jgi:photosystem II stability/assembly factor-like uncharacterized protein
MPKRSLIVLFVATCTAFSIAQDVHQPKLTAQNSGTNQLLISVSPVNASIVWASGTGGTYVVTTNGGETWKAAVVPGAENLQFRDVYAVSDRIAYLLSIGNDTNSFRIYKTVDGGRNWTIEFENETVNAFYDCFAFWTPTRGIAHSDSVNGVFPELRTTNGLSWESIAGNMPPALPGEASFAASGTCVAAQGESNAWIATGGSSVARILATRDGGNTWKAYDTPLVSSPSAGAISVAFRNPSDGIVGGGDLANNDRAETATSNDGGQTWNLTNKPPVSGAIFCLAYVRGFHPESGESNRQFERSVVVTSEFAPSFEHGAAAWTPDEGQSWFELPSVSGYWAVAFANPEAGWFVGNKGQILKISF